MTLAIMMDVDGVVVRGRSSAGESWHTDLQQDLAINYAELRQHFFDIYWADITTGRADLRDCLQPVLAKLAPTVAVDTFITYWHSQHAAVDQRVLGAVARATARGDRVLLATNQSHERADYLWCEAQLCQHFEDILYSAALGFRKPEQGFYQAAAQRTTLPPRAHLLVDDDPTNVSAAQAAGWQAKLWHPQDDLDMVIADITDVLNNT
jgi:putative hydrolase of the HAD superfamily